MPMALSGQLAKSTLKRMSRKKAGSYVSILTVRNNGWSHSCGMTVRKIPILIDNTLTPPFPVMESTAELLYLQDNFDEKNFFGFSEKREHSEMVQWLLFWQASGQPNQGQSNHFRKSAPKKIPYAISRFRSKTLRVYNVFETRLSGRYTGISREYLVGSGKGRYSIADIGAWP
ncbi:hypothetical protein IFR05_014692 [Cadophora sp. M221]|nr:hypothetical protein IFR05_014692 [Cadophora sp. M221]